MREKSESFRVSQDHIRRGARNNPAANPLALALQESGLMENPEVHPIRTLGARGKGEKLRTYQHSPPIVRWLNEWNSGTEVRPLELSVNFQHARISNRQEGISKPQG